RQGNDLTERGQCPRVEVRNGGDGVEEARVGVHASGRRVVDGDLVGVREGVEVRGRGARAVEGGEVERAGQGAGKAADERVEQARQVPAELVRVGLHDRDLVRLEGLAADRRVRHGLPLRLTNELRLGVGQDLPVDRTGPRQGNAAGQA